MEADILDAFETLSTLLSTLGYPVIEPLVKNDTTKQFFLKGKGEAIGELVEDRFVVRAGATARKEIVKSVLVSVKPRRDKLIESGVMVEENFHAGLFVQHAERCRRRRVGPPGEWLGRVEER